MDTSSQNHIPEYAIWGAGAVGLNILRDIKLRGFKARVLDTRINSDSIVESKFEEFGVSFYMQHEVKNKLERNCIIFVTLKTTELCNQKNLDLIEHLRDFHEVVILSNGIWPVIELGNRFENLHFGYVANISTTKNKQTITNKLSNFSVNLASIESKNLLHSNIKLLNESGTNRYFIAKSKPINNAFVKYPRWLIATLICIHTNSRFGDAVRLIKKENLASILEEVVTIANFFGIRITQGYLADQISHLDFDLIPSSFHDVIAGKSSEILLELRLLNSLLDLKSKGLSFLYTSLKNIERKLN
jgi:hypothetical protein